MFWAGISLLLGISNRFSAPLRKVMDCLTRPGGSWLGTGDITAFHDYCRHTVLPMNRQQLSEGQSVVLAPQTFSTYKSSQFY